LAPKRTSWRRRHAGGTAALKLSSSSASALYGRGIAKRSKGDTAGGETDIAAANAIEAGLAETYEYGIK
jgi:hypothetical protein